MWFFVIFTGIPGSRLIVMESNGSWYKIARIATFSALDRQHQPDIASEMVPLIVYNSGIHTGERE